ncbi:LuxR C-terminal-related transcriptional regulator [Mycolicibacterium sp. CBMA 226]|uniref:LuxR C-terminal-related transcriptional regulator n=1 Tax=Mycolicibacterium sp. CBMA 226 TaxID=2606611 RepID=UPI0012DFC1A4|nr:LuxR family transcriptional regulator [Mycolicibacterium sp. CBMA 226]MUL79300.1 helix-turn-helix transcriptional regulator [Mycolicibacterium sp. CBMA 226]
MRLKWPLTGRNEEVRVIADAMSDPTLAGIVLSGPAGVGKSRVARDALRALTSMHTQIRWAVGTASARALPLGAFASWAPPTADSLQLVRGVIDSLTAAPQGTRVVVVVDDAHLLDDLSVFVVHQIIQRRSARVVLTLRDGEPVPAGLEELRSGGSMARLDLQPLSQGETSALLMAALDGRVDPDAARRLWSRTRGNVLYLRNIVDQEVDEGRLRKHRGVWTWTGEPSVPPSLVGLIEARMQNLPAEVIEVVDILAVGEPLHLTSLRRMVEPTGIEEAEVQGLISLKPISDGVEVRLAHPMYGEVRRARAAQTRLRRLRGVVADELATSQDPQDMRILVRRATLCVDSDLTPDPHLLLTAAVRAMWLADLSLADRLTDAAIRAGAGVEAYFVRGNLLSWMSRGPEAEAVIAATPTDGLTEVDHARLTYVWAMIKLWTLRDPDGAKQLIDAAAALAVTPEARGWIDTLLAMFWAVMANPEAARTISARIDLERLPGIAAPSAGWAITLAAGDAGHTDDAITAADTSDGLMARGIEHAYTRFAVVDARVGALVLAGRVSEACDAAARILLQANDMPGPARLRAGAIAGRAAMADGRIDDACALLMPIVEAFSEGETNGWGYRYQLPWTTALAMRGSVDEAVVASNELERQRHPSWRIFDYEYGIAHAWVAACQGAVSSAVSTALATADIARSNGQFAAEVMCLQTAAQFGDGTGADRLTELAGIVEGPRAGLAARLATALRTGEADQLSYLSTCFGDLGDQIAAIDAAAHAALAYRKRDQRGSALTCSTRAQALARRCGATTPALRHVVQPLPLTDREREIVALLSEGLPSRDIAERLTLSTRTVEGHIYRAMAKTGTTNRDELAALLRR